MKAARTLLVVGLIAVASPAAAQPPLAGYKLHEMNFDMWCQETKHYPPERCDKRLPKDNTAFEAYVSTVEKYEVPYLQKQQQKQQFNRDIMHNDPIDNPQGPGDNTPQP